LLGFSKVSFFLCHPVLGVTLQLEFTAFAVAAQWNSWLSHCPTSRKTVALIVNEVTGIFIDLIFPAAL